MTLSEIYSRLKDGTGSDAELNAALDAYTPVVPFDRDVTGDEMQTPWLLVGIEGHRWYPPEVTLGENDALQWEVRGFDAAEREYTERHAEKPRAIAMLAVKMRISA